jgi:hypothetical protein
MRKVVVVFGELGAERRDKGGEHGEARRKNFAVFKY